MNRFTTRVLQNAIEKIPDNPTTNDEWWTDRSIDQRVLFDWIVKRHAELTRMGLSFDARSWTMVGLMIGFEIGRMSVDPSYALAAELDK